MINEQPAEIGMRVGIAIARDVRADGMPTEWTGLDPQDADQFIAAGLTPGTAAWDAAEKSAKMAFLAALTVEKLDHGSSPTKEKR